MYETINSSFDCVLQCPSKLQLHGSSSSHIHTIMPHHNVCTLPVKK